MSRGRKRGQFISRMNNTIRFKLHFGPYRTPRFRMGAMSQDARRGEVQIVGLSDARIPWPIGKQGRAKALVLNGALVRAVRRESHQAICHWFGVGASTVWIWRKTLGVRQTEGTHRLRVQFGKSDAFKQVRAAAHEQSRDPKLDQARRTKIAVARKGKPRPASVVAKMRSRMLGTSASAETRRRMSEAHKRRGTRPPKAGLA